jgi:hypothetical protein
MTAPGDEIDRGKDPEDAPEDVPDPEARERFRLRRWRVRAIVLTLILGPGFGHFILQRVARTPR